jgi:hypothetical protein
VVGDAWLEHGRVVASVFPGAHSVSAAAHVNPAAFVRHILLNLETFALGISGWVTTITIYRLPPVLCAIPLLLLGLRSVRAATPSPCGPAARLVGFAALSVLPSLVVMPKAKYSLPVLFLFGCAAAYALHGLWMLLAVRMRPLVRGTLGAVVLLVLPGVAWARLRPLPASRRVVAEITSLRKVWAAQKPTWNMLEVDGGWCAYLDLTRCRPVMLFERRPHESLTRFLRRRQVNAVMVGARLGIEARHSRDPDLQELVLRPERWGFSRTRIDPTYVLLTREPVAAPPASAR